MKKAVFFDRDGVINIDYGFVGQIENYDIVEGVAYSLRQLKDMGYVLVLVTNQSGIARGKYTEADFYKVTSFMQANLALHKACFDGIYFCPHHPQADLEKYRCDCDCRKPKSGMFLKAAAELDIDLDKSVMIGDHASDLEAARGAGIQRLYLVGEHIEEESKKISSIKALKDVRAVVLDLKNEKK
ncbi:MAG: D-glycero-beta-D-manno-heptose 1,7-bisphosphate 7-phosphatase [Succinivibrio sp.]